MKNKERVYSVIAIMVLLIASLSMYLCYDRIGDAATKRGRAKIDFTIEDILLDIVPSTDYYFAMELGELNGDERTPSERFLVQEDNEKLEGYYDQGYFDEMIYSSDQIKLESNFKYYIKDTKTNEVVTNANKKLYYLALDEVKKEYQYYIHIIYDKDGKQTIQGPRKGKWERVYKEYKRTVLADGYEASKGEILNPKNMEIIYAVPKKLNLSSGNHLIVTGMELVLEDFTMPYVITISSLLALFMLLSPIRVAKASIVFRKLKKVKIEGVFIGYLAAMTFVPPFARDLISSTYCRRLYQSLKEYGMGEFSIVIEGGINLAFWIAFFFCVLYAVFLLKYILHKGIKRYIEENTLVLWGFQQVKHFGSLLLTFDLKDSGNIYIMKIVFINFMVLAGIIVFFPYGLVLAVIYSIIVFILLRTKLLTIKQDYDTLLQATRRLSGGDYHVELNQDIGLFNTLGEEFAHIRDGLEKALKEEVKSEQMKTELISNVSHDLKTPLTSIITYVDLLKQDGLSEEDKNKFVQTLDQNAIRLKTLIEDLFEVSKANTGNLQLDIVDIDVVALMEQVRFECLDYIDGKGLDIKLSASESKIIHALDGAKTYRIFENLMMNICKYALSKTRVYIDIRNEEEAVYIALKNISENEVNFHVDDITERFVQGDKSRNGSGSGLGLAIAKSFTELQNGTFKIEVDGDLFKVIIAFKK